MLKKLLPVLLLGLITLSPGFAFAESVTLDPASIDCDSPPSTVGVTGGGTSYRISIYGSDGSFHGYSNTTNKATINGSTICSNWASEFAGSGGGHATNGETYYVVTRKSSGDGMFSGCGAGHSDLAACQADSGYLGQATLTVGGPPPTFWDLTLTPPSGGGSWGDPGPFSVQDGHTQAVQAQPSANHYVTSMTKNGVPVTCTVAQTPVANTCNYSVTNVTADTVMAVQFAVIGSYTGNGGGGGFGSFITQYGENPFFDTTDPTIGDVVTWASDNVFKLFLGSGLMVLLYLWPWITALIVLGAIIYFSFRAFQFFRH